MIEPEARTFSVDAEGEHVFLTFHVKEGTKRWLKEIRFREKDSAVSTEPLEHATKGRRCKPVIRVLLSAFSVDRLRRLIPIQDGDVFSTTKLYEGFDALEKLYKSEGYAEFSVTPTIAHDDKDHSASVTLELDKGEQFHVGKVETFGIDAALAEKLRVALPKGEIFHPAAVDAALKSMLPASAADRVDLRKNEREATVDITIDLRPCPPRECSFKNRCREQGLSPAISV